MSKPVTKADLERIYEKFILDPDWQIVVTLIEQFIEPLKNIDEIDTQGKTADEVFAEVQGRKIAYDKLSQFLDETRLLERAVTKSDTNWR